MENGTIPSSHKRNDGFVYEHRLTINRALRLPANVHPVVPSVISSGPRTKPEVALSFDDGPSDRTSALLALLAQYGVHTTFCMTGAQMARFSEAVKAVVRSGDDLCDHTQTHPHLPQLALVNPAGFAHELLKPANTMYALTGLWPAYLRPPYGDDRNKAGENILMGPAAADGMLESRWSVDGRDWSNRNAAVACARILHGALGPNPTTKAVNGSIILMHDRDDVPIVAETQCVIAGLIKEGLQPVSVSQLFAD